MSRLKIGQETLGTDFLTDLDDSSEYEIQEQLSQTEQEGALNEENLYRSVAVLEHMVELCDRLERKEKISTEDIAYIRLCKEMAVAGTGSQPEQLLPSLEHVQNGIATETVLHDIGNSIGSIMHHIGYGIKNAVDALQYNYTLLEFQSGKLRKLKSKVQELKSTQLRAKFRESKYLRYGDNVLIKDINDYTKHFMEVAEFTNKFNAASAEFLEDDLFQSYKTLVSLVHGYEEKYLELFNNLESYLDKIAKVSSVRYEGYVNMYNNKRVEIYRSPNYLGMSFVEIMKPSRSDFNPKSYEECVSVGNTFNMHFLREDKFQIESFKDNYTIDKMDKKQLLKLIDAGQEMVANYKKQMSLISRLSLIGSNYLVMDYVVSAALPFGILKILISNYRIMLISQIIALNSIKSCFVFTRGHIAKLIQLSESAVKQND